MKRLLSLVLLSTLLVPSNAQEMEGTGKRPDRIIFLIGDGMGLSAVSTTLYYGDLISAFQRFQEVGLIVTSSASHKVTDSAASGTAMSTGNKTYNGAIGVDTDRKKVRNITEVVTDLGWATGVVATSTITHATPASFYAHVPNRVMEEQIASQLLVSPIDFFAGGGLNLFIHRRDSINLLEIAANNGFTVDTTALASPGSLDPEGKYGFLLAAGGMPPMPAGRGDFLPRATALAIDYLSLQENGFFLMVEGSQIDWAGHARESEYLISEMLDFEKAIEVALDFAEKDGNTLVVVTADHETGGLALGALRDPTRGIEDYNEIEPTFATSAHSATLIPVFAYGPGAGEFNGMYENTELFHKMVRLIKGE